MKSVFTKLPQWRQERASESRKPHWEKLQVKISWMEE
jgi:hypothetical protein